MIKQAKTRSRKSRRPRRSRPWLGHSVLLALAVLSLGALFYSVYGLRPQESLSVGAPSPATFRAPVATEVVDQLLTERARQTAAAQVPPLYSTDPKLQRLVINAISSAGLPADVQDLLLVAYRDTSGVDEAERAQLIEEALALTPPERQRQVRLLLEHNLLVTSVEDPRLTAAAREAAAKGVDPVMQRLEAGQVIVRQGETLTQEQLQALTKLGLYSAHTDLTLSRVRTLIGCLLLAALLSLPILFALRHLPNLSFQQLSFLVALSLVVVAAQRLAFLVNPYFIVALLVPILVSVLASELTAIVWTVWVGAVLALLMPDSAMFTLVMVLSGGVAASLLARSLGNRTALLVAGLGGALAAALSYALVFLLFGSNFGLPTAYNLLFVLGGGLLSAFVALGLLFFAESAFDFLTDFRLTELSSPSTPLLQKLLLEAPGTYQHSLIISNLVERAVANIGGNALLARVGALYHDVGKLKRPQFFVENQFAGGNPHDQLSPHLSYLIITSHVRDGLELLRQYKLPKALYPFVNEHHGTTVLAYFYKRALEDSNKLDELNFRYPGPRPHSKEAAVLMLADAVESASRTLSEPSQGSIRALIDRLFEMRLQDGQLAESPLNFHDLEVIAATFERMLTAILHRRISYPSSEEIQSLKRAGESRGEGRSGENRGGDGQRNPARLPS